MRSKGGGGQRGLRRWRLGGMSRRVGHEEAHQVERLAYRRRCRCRCRCWCRRGRGRRRGCGRPAHEQAHEILTRLCRGRI